MISGRSRPSLDEYFLAIAKTVASRSTCARRSVGCVLVDEHGRIVSTGYNGVACGQPHCTDTPCPGALLKSGTGLDACQAIHAEQNALLFCDVMKVTTAYVTVTPCISCIKLLLAAPNCKRIVAAETYPHAEAIEMWERAGRKIEVHCYNYNFDAMRARVGAFSAR